MKQHTLQTILLLILPFCNWSQEQTDQLRLGVGYTPYLVLKKEQVNDLNGTYSHSFGLNGSLKCSDKLRLDAGVHFSNRKYTQNDLKFGQNLNPQTGVYDTTFAINYISRFIEIPISVSYHIAVSERITFFVGLGLSQQISLDQSTNWTAFPASSNSIDNYKIETAHYNLSASGANLSFGIGYDLGNHFYIQVEPFLRNYFTQKTAYLSEKTNALLGCNVRLLYRL